MLKVFVGVVRFPDDRDFVIMVDGESGPVESAVQDVIAEIRGPGSIDVMSEGVDFREFAHESNTEQNHPDGYVLAVEVSSSRRMDLAIQQARRLRHLRADR
ncbi:MAG TPA: hypothetical protein PLQ56_20785 [Aggregatilineales bacterium]|nr:hypothetical protein [Aggregatilineales bacterium]